MRVNMHDAKSNLSRLVELAASGTRVEIARAGKPIAVLSAYEPPRPRRRLGVCAGQPYSVAPDFDELPEDLARAFAGDDA